MSTKLQTTSTGLSYHISLSSASCAPFNCTCNETIDYPTSCTSGSPCNGYVVTVGTGNTCDSGTATPQSYTSNSLPVSPNSGQKRCYLVQDVSGSSPNVRSQWITCTVTGTAPNLHVAAGWEDAAL